MSDPYERASTLLTLVVSGFDAAEVTLPKLQYVAPGNTIAYDGEQVTVNVGRLFYGQPGMENDTYNPRQPMPVSCDLVVTILRDTPVVGDQGEPPSKDELQANACQNIKDMATLRQVVHDIIAKNELQDRGIPVAVSPVTGIGPMGGLVGAAQTITILVS